MTEIQFTPLEDVESAILSKILSCCKSGKSDKAKDWAEVYKTLKEAQGSEPAWLASPASPERKSREKLHQRWDNEVQQPSTQDFWQERQQSPTPSAPAPAPETIYSYSGAPSRNSRLSSGNPAYPEYLKEQHKTRDLVGRQQRTPVDLNDLAPQTTQVQRPTYTY